MREKIRRLVLGAVFLLPLPVSAKPDVPEPLKPWVSWAIKGQEAALCPFLNGPGETRCRWASPLALSMEDKKGGFSFKARLFDEDWIPLPGDADHWPLDVKMAIKMDVKIDVKAGGQPLAVSERGGRPMVRAPKGEYSVTGSFAWDAMPDSLAIPAEMGVVRLSLRGSAVKANRDDDGRLWLEAKPVAEAERDRIDLRVHRLVTDDVPLVLTTRMALEVSGKTRDLTLPSPLPEGFIPLSLESPLPAELEKDGRLKVQVKAGTWDIEFKARHHGPVSRIGLATLESPWPSDEVWAFEARNDLRLVNVGGVPAVDPTQTTLPEDWKSFPAYRVRQGDAMAFEEKRRGDSEPAPDQIALRRDIWLDFKGRGYTVRDGITGTMVRSSRLEIAPPLRLGRASVNGRDQLITTLGEGRTGVEIRQGQVNVEADSRLETGRRSLPATGWDHDFQSVSETLHLPPGWRALAVLGADRVPETWLNRWTLLEIFLVVIAALSFAKLWGKKWGVVALIALALTVTESGAPVWAWIAVLAGQALVKLIPEGKIRKLARLYRGVSLIVLIAFAVPFSVDQVRMGLYPSLEREGFYGAFDGGNVMTLGGAMAPQAMPPPPPPAEAKMAQDEPALEEMQVQRPVAASPTLKARKMMMKSSLPSQLLNEYQPGAKVQTGPGRPEWSWRRLDILWRGPVQKGQTLRLILIPPVANLVLGFVRVLLLALLLVCVLDLPEARRPRFLKKIFSKPAAAALILLSVLVAPLSAKAEFPTTEILNELRNRILEKPECAPNCATISRMRLEATPASLTARLEIHAEAASAVPLPGSEKEWSPTEVVFAVGAVSEAAPLARTPDGRLWIVVEPGVHQVLMTGPLPDRQSVQIPLPMKPHYVEAKADGWSFYGLHEDGVADENLQLLRTQVAAETSPMRSETGALPAFLRVERRIVLGLTWEVETRVERLTPVGTAVVVQVPLVVGESVTTPGFRVNDGKVAVNLGPQATEASWRSALLESPSIPLKADDATWWTETWVVEASPIWHVRMEGIPVVRHFSEGEWLPTYRPWPGEEAILQIYRPDAVEGQTLTIDRSRLSLTPGVRSTEAGLWLSLRSSLGGQHALTLPEGADLISVSLNGAVQPIRAVGATVTIPVVPGAQTVELTWNEPRGISAFFKSPKVGLGASSVNSEVRMAIPERWVIFAGGPRLGPAVLFWGLVVVILLVSLGLGRVDLTPLKTHHWFLLGLGLTQVPVWSSIFVALWLLALGWRRRRDVSGGFLFDLRQLFLAGLTVAALIVIVVSIERGLLGIPVMQIEGNGSSDSQLIWFQDRISEILPRPWAVTLPMYIYRLAMLAWAVWLAMALLKWLRWGWECFSAGGIWRPLRNRLVQK